MPTDDSLDLKNPEFEQVMSLINHTDSSVFMTGKAGTGKSTFLRYITTHTRKKHVILAPTGIAAVNAGGQTLHSFFHIPLKPLLHDDPEFAERQLSKRMKYSSRFIKLLRSLDLIVIDEISMVRADIIDFIDKILRHFCGNNRQPFAGKQILMVGDVYQLEPVVQADTRRILQRDYSCFYFFGARVFRDFTLVPIELKKVYRQTDPAFIGLLDRVRSGRPDAADLAAINSRVVREGDEKTGCGEDMAMVIAARRDTAAYINETRLAEIEGEPTEYEAEVSGDFPETSFPTDRTLRLKVGAQVVFIRNDPERRWVNGSIGRVAALRPGEVDVTLEDGETHTVGIEGWDNITYKYNEEKKSVEEEVKGSFRQLPLRLAWALTIHKSQGLTFSKIVIDVAGGAFAGGQSYVALSRCTSLEGISMASPMRRSDIYVNPDVARFSTAFNDPGLVLAAMKSARADSLYAQTAHDFDSGNYTAAVASLAEAVDCRNELNSPVFKRAAAMKLYGLAQNMRRVEALEAEIEIYKAVLQDLAMEYVAMGNECLADGWDTTPAMANYNKALRLVPELYEARIGRGKAFLAAGDAEAAIDEWEAAAREPDRYDAQYQLGSYYLGRGDHETALEWLLRAAKIAETDPTVEDAVADAYEAAGDTRRAARHRARAAQLRKKKG